MQRIEKSRQMMISVDIVFNRKLATKNRYISTILFPTYIFTLKDRKLNQLYSEPSFISLIFAKMENRNRREKKNRFCICITLSLLRNVYDSSSILHSDLRVIEGEERKESIR